MAISFYPRAGQILMCDFSGFREPEMNKIRPVIVISPRLPNRSEIVAVVPISLTAPVKDFPFVVRLSKNYHPSESDDLPCWAKCDMLLNIGRFRLDGFKVDRRKWETPQASGADLAAVRQGVLAALKFDS
jgi:mRNA interferase MazF